MTRLGLLHRRQVDGGIFAAPIDLQLEFEPVALVEGGHAGAFDRADVHECIGLAIVALNEAEALHRVEELDRARRLLTRQLTLRATGTTGTATRRTRTGIAITRRAAILDRHRLAIDLEIGRRDAAATIDKGEAKRLTLGQTRQPGLLDRADVHEHVLAAVIADNKAKALLAIEKLYDPGAFTNDLWGHAASSTAAATGRAAKAAAAAKTAAATATAEAIAAAAEPVATAAEAITTATKTVTTTKAAIESALAETIALVFATPATIAAAPFIETHALFVFPVRP